MLRSRILAIAVVSVCSMSVAQANMLKDTGRVMVGGAAGASLQIAGGVAREFWQKGMKFEFNNTFDANFTPVYATIGALCALAYTTYGRTLRAQWNIWGYEDSNLVKTTMGDYEDDAELIAALEECCINSTYPLVTAKKELAIALSAFKEAAELIEAAINDLDENSSRMEDLDDWVGEVYMLVDYVTQALMAIEKDPRLPGMMEAQNRKDFVDARVVEATAKFLTAGADIYNATK